MKPAIALIPLCLCATPALADPIPVTQADKGRARLEMFRRVNKAVVVYAISIGLDAEWADYCRLEHERKTELLRSAGKSSFPVGYSEIDNKEWLDITIQIEESYDKNGQILCLAQAKNALTQASQK